MRDRREFPDRCERNQYLQLHQLSITGSVYDHPNVVDIDGHVVGDVQRTERGYVIVFELDPSS